MTDHAPSAAPDRAPEVYLCQVNARVSCGACCGLYNLGDLSRGSLHARLARRTERFAAVPRTEEHITGFRRLIEGWTPEDRPFPQFHHCPYLGLVGARRSRVGCLLHPQAPGNHGRDWRHLSYYGAKACRTYFCPASRMLPARYLRIVRDLVDDWFGYGLVITEHLLLQALFEALEQRLEAPLPSALPASPAVRRELRNLFAVKQSWPFRRGDGPGLCHFPFDNGLYVRPAVQWPSPARPAGVYQVVFRELESVFTSEVEMHAAVRWLDARLDALAACLQADEGRDPAEGTERIAPCLDAPV